MPQALIAFSGELKLASQLEKKLTSFPFMEYTGLFVGRLEYTTLPALFNIPWTV